LAKLRAPVELGCARSSTSVTACDNPPTSI